MTKKSATIVLFGNERIATGVTTTAPTLQKLQDQGHTIKMVVANNQQQASRKQRQLEIAVVAEAHNIPVVSPSRLRDISDTLKECKADIGVLVAYGKMVPQEIIDIFPMGIVNIHPSLLPLHRGSIPLESVILAGEEQTGVSLMGLVKKMDAGPVYAQEVIDLKGRETKQELADLLLDIGSDLLVENLPRIIDGTLIPYEQDDSKATYDMLITKQDGRIDWSKPAIDIEREVRAYAEWPKSYTQWGILEAVVTEAHVSDHAGPSGTSFVDGRLPAVYCGTGSLVIDRIKPAGKQEMTGEAFLAGYKQHFLNA
jgi:methionyl-tRNA formyltransferase